MTESILHEIENDQDTQSFLKENGEKFNRQCVQVLQVLYRGGRWTGKEINDLLDIACGDRRLRDIKASRGDCKKAWRMGNDGKRASMEYWIEKPKVYPTKSELQEWFHQYQKEQAPVIDIRKNSFIQQNLFD